MSLHDFGKQAALGSLLLVVSSAGAQLIGVDYDSGKIYNISTVNGAATFRCNGLLQKASDICYGPDGKHYMFGSGPNATLYSVNINSGALTTIGGLGLPYTFEGALTFSNGGVAYATNAGEAENPSFFTLNTGSGLATVVDTIGLVPHDINGMVWRQDGQLVGIDRETNSLVAFSPGNGSLTYIKTYDPNAGEPLLGAVGGMCMYNGDAYFCTAAADSALQGDNSLWKVSLTTGNATLVGVMNGITGFGISGLTVVPEPSTGLAVAGALVLAARLRRRVNSDS
jgi:hypothetical protein